MSNAHLYRPPFKAHCRGPNCGKQTELVIVAWNWKPRKQEWEPKWHPFNLAMDLGSGDVRNSGISHFTTCVDAEKFGGSQRAVPLPPGPVYPPEPPANPQRRLFE